MSWPEAKWIADRIINNTGYAPGDMRSFSVKPESKSSLSVQFLEPEDIYIAGNLTGITAGVVIRMSESGYPTNPTEGTLVLDNRQLGKYESTEYIVTGLTEGKTYYFSAFPYNTQGIYNLTYNASNRAQAAPADDEKVNVFIGIDDASEFTSVTVTCVDESNSAETTSVTLTSTKTSHMFTVPIGDTYHIEYGEAQYYSKPANTTSKVSVAGAVTNYTANYKLFKSTINVTYPAGSTLTCTCGDTAYVATTTTGTYAFVVHNVGTWTISSVDGSLSDSEQVSITADGQTKSVSLSYFTATISVTYPAGSTVTCSKGSTVYTAPTTTGSYQFVVHEAGTWTVISTNGSRTDTKQVVISTDGQSASVTLTYFAATINVSYPAGSTLTCTSGDTTLTASTTTGNYAFVVPKAGTWTVTSTNGSQSDSAQVSITTDGQSVSVSLTYFSASINVTYPAGATLTCRKGSTTYTAPTSTGSYTFTVRESGTWTVTATQGSNTKSQSVSITSSGQSVNVTLSFVHIYGISRYIDRIAPDWTRTDDAVGFTATASVGTTAGSSSFNNCYPWSGIVRETIGNRDSVMVKIPKFYFRRYREGSTEYIKIADSPADGFKVHPAFNHAGVEKDYVYVGAYKTSNMGASYYSKSGKTPSTIETRAGFRDMADTYTGAGWYILDIATLSAIQMLILVEFATNDLQSAIGRGFTYANAAITNTGTCDSVPHLTGRPAGTDGQVDVVWRGIEGLWGNVWEYIDGINYNNGEYYVSNDPSYYKDKAITGYYRLSYTGSTDWNGYYITHMGLDTNGNEHIMLPSQVGGSEGTYYTDASWNSAGWKDMCHGGDMSENYRAGLFEVWWQDTGTKGTRMGSRLMYIPQ